MIVIMEIQTHIKTRAEVLKEFAEAYDARFFKTLSEPVRMQILCYLMMNGRSDIGSITENMPQDRSVVSRHLNQMHEVGILRCEKETRHMFYSINGQVFIDKLEGFLSQIKKSVSVCCPPDCCSK
jgi:ArsR family transcriptional regulator, zinc-responsive transcriptional repressor